MIEKYYYLVIIRECCDTMVSIHDTQVLQVKTDIGKWIDILETDNTTAEKRNLALKERLVQYRTLIFMGLEFTHSKNEQTSRVASQYCERKISI
jgi:hypothetical protein